MTQDPLTQDIPEPDNTADTTAAETPAATDSAAGNAEAALQARVAELEAQLAALNDKALRALAEADNTRKRAEKERQDTAKFSVAGFARDMLGVADNLGRALAAITPEQRAGNEQLKSIYDGVQATERELMRVLESNGIRKIEPLDQIFDPNLHEVMFESPVPGKAPGTVIQILEAGYMIHDRLLRPARVGVAKGDGNAEGGHLDEEV